jgi:hypothetical protein
MVVNHHEPETYADLEALPEYAATKHIFQKAGWEPFFKKFDGYDDKITLQFALHFHGGLAKVGELEFEVTEQFISEAIQLPSTGQRWTKGQPVDKKLCTQLLQPQYRKLQWSEGTSRSWLEPKWAQLLSILQRYLTCEGRYTIVFPCHARLLLHFKGNHLVNIPYFLLKSLKRMSEQVRKAKDFRGSLFHFGLVKILVKIALSHKQESWDMFVIKTLASENSKDKTPESIATQKKSSSKKKVVKTLAKVCNDPEYTPDCNIEANDDNPVSEHSFDVHSPEGLETSREKVENVVHTDVNIEAQISSPTDKNVIDVEELEDLIVKPRRNPKRKCTFSDMDNSVPSYPLQERMKSMTDHEDAPESSEMTWTLSQLIRKVREVNQQENVPEEIVQDKPVEIPVDTPVQVPDEFTHESNPQTQQGHCETFKSYCEISSSRSLRPMVVRLENMNHRLKEKLHEYAILDRHIKTENELMKLRQAHFLAKIERLKQKNRSLLQKNKRLQRIARKHITINRVLKKEIRNIKKHERLQMLVAAAATL